MLRDREALESTITKIVKGIWNLNQSHCCFSRIQEPCVELNLRSLLDLIFILLLEIELLELLTMLPEAQEDSAVLSHAFR